MTFRSEVTHRKSVGIRDGADGTDLTDGTDGTDRADWTHGTDGTDGIIPHRIL